MPYIYAADSLHIRNHYKLCSRLTQGRGSHSAEGANAPPTFGPMEQRWEHAPPTFSEVKWSYRSFGEGNVKIPRIHIKM